MLTCDFTTFLLRTTYDSNAALCTGAVTRRLALRRMQTPTLAFDHLLTSDKTRKRDKAQRDGSCPLFYSRQGFVATCENLVESDSYLLYKPSYRARQKSNPLGKIRYLQNCSKFFCPIYAVYRGGFRPYILQISLEYLVAFENYNYLNLNVHFSK